MNAALWGTVVAALIAAVIAPWVKARIDSRSAAAGDIRVAKAELAAVTEDRVERLFKEYDRLRNSYRSDIDDLRSQNREAVARIQSLEHEVAEWRAGIRGVIGVWVAVPASVMEYIREHLPDLPPTRFPGEPPARDSVEK